MAKRQKRRRSSKPSEQDFKRGVRQSMSMIERGWKDSQRRVR